MYTILCIYSLLLFFFSLFLPDIFRRPCGAFVYSRCLATEQRQWSAMLPLTRSPQSFDHPYTRIASHGQQSMSDIVILLFIYFLFFHTFRIRLCIVYHLHCWPLTVCEFITLYINYFMWQRLNIFRKFSQQYYVNLKKRSTFIRRNKYCFNAHCTFRIILRRKLKKYSFYSSWVGFFSSLKELN